MCIYVYIIYDYGTVTNDDSLTLYNIEPFLTAKANNFKPKKAVSDSATLLSVVCNLGVYNILCKMEPLFFQVHILHFP